MPVKEVASPPYRGRYVLPGPVGGGGLPTCIRGREGASWLRLALLRIREGEAGIPPEQGQRAGRDPVGPSCCLTRGLTLKN